MKKNHLALLIAGFVISANLTASPLAVPTASQAAQDAVIPVLSYERFTLPNGLTVVVHEDHKAPVVAVSVWYHVGSSYEPTGKTGFAHLFEHLMFAGSENHKSTYFGPFEQAGVTDMNGTTWFDRTNYFETVPNTALDMALWMESDRMGHLLGAIGQHQLDLQRGVVQNEKRQGENQPYGRASQVMQANTYPANHPYHHDTIGSMSDLDQASLDDVRQWFRSYYGAANTLMVLSGDITPTQAKEKMQKYFSDIAPGPQVSRPAVWVAPREQSTRETMTDNVPQTRIYRQWNVPSRTDLTLAQLDLAATVLGSGKTSRLYQRLVYRDKLADGVSVDIEPHVLASNFNLQVDVKQGVDPAKVEKAIAEEWHRFLQEGPATDELERTQTMIRAAFVRDLERVNAQATLLAEGQLYQNDPQAYLKKFAALMAATPASVRTTARQWIARGDYTLTVVPGKVTPHDVAETAGLKAQAGRPKDVLGPSVEKYRAEVSEVDRGKGVPKVASFPDLSFPKLQHGKLDNGIEVILTERHSIPTVQIKLLFDGGYASDQGHKLGTAAFTMGMLDEGTQDLDSIEIAKRKQYLGAMIGTGCDLDTCAATLDTLDDKLADSLALFTDIVRRPAFREADMQRVRGLWLAQIAQEKSSPIGLALRTLPPLLYGTGHPYAIPFTGSGTEASIQSLDVGDMRAFMRDYVRPDNVRILVAGDTTLEQIIPELNKAFGGWRATGSKTTNKIAKVTPPARPRVFLLDRPGAPQSLIMAAGLAPSSRAPNDLAIGTMNDAFGGSFTSRLNMNLREDKHWAYGAGSFLSNAEGQRPFLMYAPVQSDQTAPAVTEMLKEARALIGDQPLSAAEIAKVKDNRVRSLPGTFQTTTAVMSALTGIVEYQRPDDYVQTLKARTEALKDTDAQAAAREVVKPDQLTWVIVGDLKHIQPQIAALKLGTLSVLDADGKPESEVTSMHMPHTATKHATQQ